MIETKNLTCGYGSKIIIEDINLQISCKDFVGIIGPNGSGKTTLLRAITKILKPEKGEILIEGNNISQVVFKELAKKVAIVSQNLEPTFMTVEEFVLLGRIPYYNKFQLFETNKDKEIVEKCMFLTDILELKDRFIPEISGGERQLVCIARALAQEPKILILDEPTAHLDIAHQVKILNLIKKLNKELGLTVIIVLHDLNLAGEYCDHIVLFNNGRIHKIGYPEEVLTYQMIEEVYKTVVVVEKNPISNKPYVILVANR
ncbi:MAG: ABC transporter ATP-binding protein [Candidatus Firestonebacteria bacterium]